MSFRRRDRNVDYTVVQLFCNCGPGVLQFFIHFWLGDDGLGPQAIARLQSEFEFGNEVGLLDIGTPTLDFVDCLRGREVLVLIDALSGGGEPGEILTFDKARLREFLPNMRLSAHQPCLNETLHIAETAGIDLKEVLLVGVVGHSFDVGTELGPTSHAPCRACWSWSPTSCASTTFQPSAELWPNLRILGGKPNQPLNREGWFQAAIPAH